MIQPAFLTWSRFYKSFAKLTPACHQNSDQSPGSSKTCPNISKDALLCLHDLLLYKYIYVFKSKYRASLVAQWLRIRLPMQETWVWSLAREDPTCPGATKPVRHNYWACALEPVLCSKRSHDNEKPTHHKKSSPCLPQLEKAHAWQWRPNTAKKIKK